MALRTISTRPCRPMLGTLRRSRAHRRLIHPVSRLLFVAILLLSPCTAFAQKEVQFVRNFPCAVTHPVKRIGGDGTAQNPVHFRITFPDGRAGAGFFLFRLANVKGKTVRVDFKTTRADNWTTLNPVYAYPDRFGSARQELATPELFQSASPTTEGQRALSRAPNGPNLPDTTGQHWHFIPNAKAKPKQNLFTFTHTFGPAPTGRQGDDVYVSMKYPFTPAYLKRYVRRIRTRRAVTVHEAGWSSLPNQRPLYVVQVGQARFKDGDPKPCVVMYAREHADEHDSSWAAQGAIEFLSSRKPRAQRLREMAVFLIVPLLDPDGAVESRYSRITHSFTRSEDEISHEAIEYFDFFMDWVTSGKRLDLVFNMHNVESNETPHVRCPLIEPEADESIRTGRSRFGRTLHQRIRKRMTRLDINVAARPGERRYTAGRLSSILRREFRTLPAVYQVNSQAPSRHLLLSELRKIGVELAVGGATLLHSDKAQPVLQKLDRRTAEWRRNWKRYGAVAEAQFDHAIDISIWLPGSDEQEAEWRKPNRDFPHWAESIENKPWAIPQNQSQSTTP